MSVAIIGVAGTVIGAGASIYATSSSNKQAKQSASATTQGLKFGQTPKAAEYRPVDFTQEQWDAVNSNLSNIGPAADLMGAQNRKIDSDALRRASLLVPNYAENMRLQGQAAGNLLGGRLPYDDVLDIVAKRGGAAGALGVPGTAAPATFRDLGISQLEGLKTGAGLMKGMVDIAEQIDPVNRRARPQDSAVNPTDRIRMAMEQNQLIQQSDQNRNNLEAGLPPADLAASQLALAQRLGSVGGGGSSGSEVGGYAQALQGLLAGLGSAYRGSASTSVPAGTYSGQFAANPNPNVKNQIYRPYSAGSTSIPLY